MLTGRAVGDPVAAGNAVPTPPPTTSRLFGPTRTVRSAPTQVPPNPALDSLVVVRFAARGGKIVLLYHGWADEAIPPFATLDYYQAVVRQVGSFAESQSFSRLYMVPGAYHCPCGINSNGDPQTTVDVLPRCVGGLPMGCRRPRSPSRSRPRRPEADWTLSWWRRSTRPLPLQGTAVRTATTPTYDESARTARTRCGVDKMDPHCGAAAADAAVESC